MKKVVLLAIVLMAISFGCSTDLNVMDDYKETAIVYGLLNQNDTAQYIKINKAFLGPGNALQIAQVFDSISYQHQLTVQLQEVDPIGKNVLKTILLIPDSSIAKPAGIFA